MTVSGTPGTGTITLSAASSGYQSFATAYGANATVDILIEEGTAWEVARDCTYTNSGTTVTRGTLEASSTGSAVSFTSAAVVSEIATATKGTWHEVQLRSVIPGGRLTLESGVPVSTTDQTAKTTIYYTPFVHNVINLWDGANWVPTEFTETSLALGTLIASRTYDVFGYLDAGALVLESLGWASSTVTITIASPGVVSWTAHGHENGDSIVFATTGSLPTGLTAGTTYYVVNKATDTFQLAAVSAGTAINTTGSQSGTHTAYSQDVRGTAVTLQDGRYCKSGDKTRLLLGTFFTATTTTTESSLSKRFLDNVYNRVALKLFKSTSTVTWTYATATWRAANADSTYRVQIVRSIPSLASVSYVGGANALGSGRYGYVGVGVNTTATRSDDTNARIGWYAGSPPAGQEVEGQATATIKHYAPAGVTYYQAVEYVDGGANVRFFGDFGDNRIVTGLIGECNA